MLPVFAAISMITTLSISMPVGAQEAAFAKLVWHNIVIEIKQPAKEAEKPDELTTTFADYERISKGGKVITTLEAQKVFGAPLYRPAAFRVPLVSSNGLYTQRFTVKDGKMGEAQLHFDHWDLFAKGDEWAVVIQDLDTYTENILNQKETVREEYPAFMKVLQIPGSDNFALLTPLFA